MKKPLTVYFYILDAEENVLESLKNGLLSLNNRSIEDRVHQYRNSKYLGEVFRPLADGSFFMGLVKERTSWPYWLRENGLLDELRLPEGTLAEVTYSLVFPARRIFIMIFNNNGPSQKAYEAYLSFLAQAPIELAPIYTRDAYERMLRWGVFKKLIFKVAAPSPGIVSSSLESELDKALDLLARTGAIELTVTLSMSRYRGSLAIGTIHRLIKALLNLEDRIQKLEVRGSESEEMPRETLDLIEERLKFRKTVEISENYLPRADALEVLIEASRTYRDYLNEFSP